MYYRCPLCAKIFGYNGSGAVLVSCPHCRKTVQVTCNVAPSAAPAVTTTYIVNKPPRRSSIFSPGYQSQRTVVYTTTPVVSVPTATVYTVATTPGVVATQPSPYPLATVATGAPPAVPAQQLYQPPPPQPQPSYAYPPQHQRQPEPPLSSHHAHPHTSPQVNLPVFTGPSQAPWACPACTFLNQGSVVTCSMCETTKPTNIPVTAASAPIPSTAFAPPSPVYYPPPATTAAAVPSTPWTCKFCTLQNSPNFEICAACDALRP